MALRGGIKDGGGYSMASMEALSVRIFKTGRLRGSRLFISEYVKD
jgi:hypothetical protein